MSEQRRLGQRFARRVGAMSVGRLLGATIGVLLVLGVVGIGLALVASSQLSEKRHVLLDEISPSLRTSLELENALVNEETGVRGYIITGEASFLAPYDRGLADERKAYRGLRSHSQAIGALADREVEQVRVAAQAWRSASVEPILAHTENGDSSSPANRGKSLFDAVREALAALQGGLTREDHLTRAQLSNAASALDVLLIVAAVLILGGILGAGFILRRTVSRPLARLGAEAGRVAAGEFDKPLRVASGPSEVASVGAEIDAMRERIVQELASVRTARSQLERQAIELRRSNAELEQFAYVASHDLQEPLRKVASFCQALQTRYHGRLDDRADQYIDFAVDGAKRMQALINDLLEFSRVGRGERPQALVPLSEPLADAEAALAGALADAQARIVASELPAVLGDRTLLGSLFQNLIGNAVKFHGASQPVVTIEARRRGELWELSCADNGIGIEPEYAERIFLIFQRLHTRESYEGSGIGLALCRKIVEYHGGRIWLDTQHSPGTCFRFTLPVAPAPHDNHDTTLATEAR
jgi:signal transduction histidine kinase